MSPSTSPAFTTLADREIRVVVEAECASCGPIGRKVTADLEVIRCAITHTVETGHVVILNGTVDRPDLEGLEILQ